ncbi:polyunsaturated fatty acid 5-lipoxygenase-like [Diadema antillarum]|uniref:polyunsaturated fatty acid 5-lipoxygenase-like n=1 Tax=Diadema antillarum TaxID=105358 RepID=UPI003A88A46B
MSNVVQRIFSLTFWGHELRKLLNSLGRAIPLCNRPSQAPRGLHHKVFVKTGDRVGMGTDADVYIAFYNTDGFRTRDFKLDKAFFFDFKRGKLDEFDIYIDNENFGPLAFIEIWLDEWALLNHWYCEYIEVQALNTEVVHKFPVNRWIPADRRLQIREFDMVLPQEDKTFLQRKWELQRKAKLYSVHKDHQTTMLMVLIGKVVALEVEIKIVDIATDKWESLKDIETIYQHHLLPPPTGMTKWRSDVEFGNQRLNGCNPTQIRLCTDIPDNFAVNERDVQLLIENMTIDEAIARKRLFIVNYDFLKDLPCTDGRTICAPMALFFVDKAKHLMPIAIQLFQDPAPNNPVFYPSDPEYTWLLAKCYFNSADASVHESAVHLGFTHFVGESIILATHRCLSPSHPVFRLLAPHFLFLLAINNLAVNHLVVEGGWVDTTMAIGRIGMFEIVRRKWQKWRLDVQGSLLADLEDRGVADPEVLPNYHYRDDAVLIRRAIFDYVKRIIDCYYDSSEKIQQDKELQEWGRFLGGEPKNAEEATVGMQGLPNSGQFLTTDEVAETVTNFVFICSAGHAAANFGQYDRYGFPPNYPAWLHGQPPRDKTPLTEKDILQQLPDLEETLRVMTVTKLLSTRDTKALGDFEMCYLYDPHDCSSLKQFQADLEKIGGMIDERNTSREEKYTCLHPSDIPNAISI